MISPRLFPVVAVIALVLVVSTVECYAPALMTRRSAMTMRKGRKSLNKTIKNGLGGNSAAGVRPMGGESTTPATKSNNWVAVSGLTSLSDLPQEDNKVQLVETMAKQLMDAGTNPNGAVSVVNFDGKTYCFSSSCTACKIPLTKATVLSPTEETNNIDPRLACDFCSATYNIRTGETISDAGGTGGLIGGAVRGLFGASKTKLLPTYDLGEKNGNVLINLP